MVGLEGIDQMNALGQHLSGHPPKQGEHADVAGIHTGHGGEDHDHQHERSRRNPEQPQYRAGIGVNHVAVRLIEYRHRIPSRGDCMPTEECQVAGVVAGDSPARGDQSKAAGESPATTQHSRGSATECSKPA